MEIRAYYTIYGTGTKDNPTKLSKREALKMLAKGRAELKAEGAWSVFDWSYIRSNRRSLMQAYAITHPNHPLSVRCGKWPKARPEIRA